MSSVVQAHDAPAVKAPGYFEWMRGDILPLIPESVTSVLSVGCATGRTEVELIARGAKVVGIEVNEEAAAEAARRGIDVICSDVQDAASQLTGMEFDCLLYADILEHLLEPERVLSEHVQHLKPGGLVVVSVPNFRHYSVFSALFLRGHVRYGDSGIFDRTHVRLTTRRMVEEWLNAAGVTPVLCQYKVTSRSGRLVSLLTAGLVRAFASRQVIIKGVRR